MRGARRARSAYRVAARIRKQVLLSTCWPFPTTSPSGCGFVGGNAAARQPRHGEDQRRPTNLLTAPHLSRNPGVRGSAILSATGGLPSPKWGDPRGGARRDASIAGAYTLLPRIVVVLKDNAGHTGIAKCRKRRHPSRAAAPTARGGNAGGPLPTHARRASPRDRRQGGTAPPGDVRRRSTGAQAAARINLAPTTCCRRQALLDLLGMHLGVL
jgi:hypothetical protein